MDSYDICIPWKLIEKEPAFALDPGVLVPRLHHYILAENRAGGNSVSEKRKDSSGRIVGHSELIELMHLGDAWMRTTMRSFSTTTKPLTFALALVACALCPSLSQQYMGMALFFQSGFDNWPMGLHDCL